MSLSQENRFLLMQKLRKTDIPDGDAKITLTMNNLGKLLDAAREEGREEGREEEQRENNRHVSTGSAGFKGFWRRGF